MKRIVLFLATNLAVMLVLSIVLSLLSSFFGINTKGSSGLLLMAMVFGFGGSIISLLMFNRLNTIRAFGHPFGHQQ
jgi:heat shock protein HtpX